MERLCLALCHPPLIKKSRLWPTHCSVSLFRSFYNDRRVFFTQTVIICCRYSHGNLIPVLFLFTGWPQKQQAWVHALIPGIRPWAAFRHHRREAVPLPGVSPSVSHQQPCKVRRSSFFHTSQTVARMWGIQDSFTESKAKVPLWVLRGMFRLFITLPVKFAARKHQLEKTTNTHSRCKMDAWYFSLILSTRQKKKKRNMSDTNPTAAKNPFALFNSAQRGGNDQSSD